MSVDALTISYVRSAESKHREAVYPMPPTDPSHSSRCFQRFSLQTEGSTRNYVAAVVEDPKRLDEAGFREKVLVVYDLSEPTPTVLKTCDVYKSYGPKRRTRGSSVSSVQTRDGHAEIAVQGARGFQIFCFDPMTKTLERNPFLRKAAIGDNLNRTFSIPGPSGGAPSTYFFWISSKGVISIYDRNAGVPYQPIASACLEVGLRHKDWHSQTVVFDGIAYCAITPNHAFRHEGPPLGPNRLLSTGEISCEHTVFQFDPQTNSLKLYPKPFLNAYLHRNRLIVLGGFDDFSTSRRPNGAGYHVQIYDLTTTRVVQEFRRTRGDWTIKIDDARETLTARKDRNGTLEQMIIDYSDIKS